MRRLSALALSFILATMVSASAWAWGKTGHRVSGQIANAHLSGDSRNAVQDILGVEDLAEASTWPDFMRSNDDDFWRKEASPYHYVTIPKNQTYAEAGAPERGDAITALAKFRKVLRDGNATLEDKQLALRFIIHIIGDLHQPMHAGDGTDRGGNDFSMTFFGDLTNLHRVWDTGLIKQEELSYSELSKWLERRITPEQIKEWSIIDPIVWAEESAAIRDTIYPTGDRDEAWGYVYDNRETLRTRLSQSGIRLSAYLNDIFAEQ